ncbi:MAG: glycosyltransferase family 2 protein [Sarcina sp.]
MVKVTIIIPVYNAIENIEETLRSAINQTYENKEIILIDDGSNDGSGEVIKKYLNKNIFYFYQENKGVSVARNKGIELASGDYIMFLDSDDILDENKVIKQIEAIKRDKADICYCGYNLWEKKKNTYNKYNMKFKKGFILEDYLNENTIPQTCTWLIDKKILKKVDLKFTDGCSWGEDIEFFSKLLLKGKCTYVKEFLVNYRVDNTHSLTRDFEFSYRDIEMWERLIEWLSLNSQVENDVAKYKKIINNYRINRSYIDTILKNIEKKEVFNELEKLEGVKLGLKLKLIKLYIKKIYILVRINLRRHS